MRLGYRIKKFLGILFAIAMVTAAVVMVVKQPRIDHIEDTNGRDNYALQQLTEEDVLGDGPAYRGMLGYKEAGVKVGIFKLGGGVQYFTRKLSGVATLFSTEVREGEFVYMTLNNLKVRKGNLVFYVILNDEIVGEITPDQRGALEFSMDHVPSDGVLKYVVACESASFKLTTGMGWLGIETYLDMDQ